MATTILRQNMSECPQIDNSICQPKLLLAIHYWAKDGCCHNAGQILNHEMYFAQFKPAGEAVQGPEGSLAAQIEKQWGSVEAFKAEFEAKGVGLFGSGWVWLSADADGSLVITQEQGASNPVVKGLKPLLTFDVWEHAYYLDYQNRRAAHLAALWQIIDWEVIAARYDG